MVERRESPLIVKKDRKKLFKAGAIFLLWIIAVFYIGSIISKTSTEMAKENPKMSEVQNPTGYGVPDAQKTPEQKANTEKLQALNRKAINNDVRLLNSSLGLDKDGWEQASAQERNGLPALFVYFPHGQNTGAWRESFVMRSFANITLPSPCPTVYKVYEQWLKEQVPDIKIEQSEDESGIAFSGFSSASKLFISGKVFSGSLKETVHIVQYVIKNDGRDDVETKARTWSSNLSRIK